MNRIEELQNRLNIAVDYAMAFRSESDPELVEACEKSIRYANMLSAAIVALSVTER